MPQTHRLAIPLFAAAAFAGLAACWPGHRPGGSEQSIDEHTYISTPDFPKTVRVVDWTTNTTLWSVDVPVGKQVTIRFYDDHDPKNTARPALMRWEIYEAGNEFGDLHNAMPVPDAGHRKIVWDVQKTPAVPTPENTEGARSPAPGGR